MSAPTSNSPVTNGDVAKALSLESEFLIYHTQLLRSIASLMQNLQRAPPLKTYPGGYNSGRKSRQGNHGMAWHEFGTLRTHRNWQITLRRAIQTGAQSQSFDRNTKKEQEEQEWYDSAASGTHWNRQRILRRAIQGQGNNDFDRNITARARRAAWHKSAASKTPSEPPETSHNAQPEGGRMTKVPSRHHGKSRKGKPGVGDGIKNP